MKIQPSKNCILCGSEFFRRKSGVGNVAWKSRVFCSRSCVNKSFRGKLNARKKVGSKNSVPAWNKGKKSPYPAWNKGHGEYAKKLGFGRWMTGKKHTAETRRKQSEIVKKRVAEGKHNFYIDGRTPLNQKIRHSVDYKVWRDAVFNRDDYTCQECGDRSGKGHAVYIHAHHLKPFATFPELRFVVSNGLTLCDECHYDRHKKD